MSFAIIYITHESESAAKQLTNQLLQEKHIACANIFPITSAYWWQGAVANEGEWVSIVKTTLERWPEVRNRVEELHPYEIPCIMKITVEANEAYEEWIRESVGDQ